MSNDSPVQHQCATASNISATIRSNKIIAGLVVPDDGAPPGGPVRQCADLRGPRGAYMMTFEALSNRATTGQPIVAATCAGPVSTEIMPTARSVNAIKRGAVISRARL